MEYVVPLSKVSEDNRDTVGIRAVDLVVLRKKLVSVPASWVVTTKAFSHFLDHNHLRPKIKELLRMAVDDVSLHSAYQMILGWTDKAEMPADLLDELEEAYGQLRKSEDLSQAKRLVDSQQRPLLMIIPSFTYGGNAEENEGIFVNVRGLDELTSKLKRCWASAFSPQEIRGRQALEVPEPVKMGIILQQMITTDVSGVVYAQGAPREGVKIRASLGYPDYTNRISADEYTVSPESLQITSSTVDTQLFQWAVDPRTEEYLRKPLGEKGAEQKLVKKEILELAKLAKRVRSYLGQDVKVFFLMHSQVFYISQVNRMAQTGREKSTETLFGERQSIQPERKLHLEKSEPWLELSDLDRALKPKEKKEPAPVEEEAKKDKKEEVPPVLENSVQELKELVAESQEDKSREVLLEKLLKAKGLIYEIEYLMFKNEREKFNGKLSELKDLVKDLN